MSDQDTAAELDRLRAENEALKKAARAKPVGLSFKVSEKGGVSVYGMGRFPVTLYYEQWVRLLEQAKELLHDRFTDRLKLDDVAETANGILERHFGRRGA